MFKDFSKKLILATVILLTISWFGMARADYQGQQVNFFVDKNYDLSGKEQISASLVYISPKIYFYVDDAYWGSLSADQKQNNIELFNSLAQEYNTKIYPTLTTILGNLWDPGIDNDTHITVLFEQIRKDAGGYFSNGNEYYKAQYPSSNEREMIYLNTEDIASSLLKSYFTHEFQHLIAFNQKEKTYGVQEDVWLNEMRSEMAISLLGYNDVYQGSNLQKRVKVFLDRPTDSLTGWDGKVYDYGIINLFGQYLLDQYGTNIFSQTIKMKETGIASINKFLVGNGNRENFSDVFTNWTVAVLINDCSYGNQYCYKTESIKKLQVVPTTNFLPITGKSSLQLSKVVKNWAGDWEKFIGGSANLKLEFSAAIDSNFRLPYIIEDSTGKISVNFLKLDAAQRGVITVPSFGSKNSSLTIIPSLQSKLTDFDLEDQGALYSFTASVVDSTDNSSSQDQKLIDSLLAQIELLKKQIADLQAKLAQQNQYPNSVSCSSFANNLYYGIKNNNEVVCLQDFLISKGFLSAGFNTGNYLALTVSAVKTYQGAKGITQTGYFGPLTRVSANKELGIMN